MHLTHRPALVLAASLLPMSLIAPASAAVAKSGESDAPATVARAAATGTVTIAPIITRVRDCVMHPYSYSFSGFDPKYASSWTLKMTFGTTTGGYTTSDTVISQSFAALPNPGTGSLQVCGNLSTPGTYVANPVLSYTDTTSGTPQRTEVTLPPVSFELSNKSSTASLKVRKKGKSKLRVQVLARSAAGAEQQAYVGASVKVQYQHKGLWVKLKRAKGKTNNLGEATFKVKRPKGAKKFRAVLKAEDFVDGSTSKVVRVK